MSSAILNSAEAHTVTKSEKGTGAFWRNKYQSAHSESLSRLLQTAGMIGAEQLCDAMEIAEALGKGVDQVLLTSFLNQVQADLASQAQKFVDEGKMTEQLAADGLSLANARGLSFMEGLKYFGFGW